MGGIVPGEISDSLSIGWLWSLDVFTVMGALWERPRCRTVSVEAQLVELSIDPWRATVSFLVIITGTGTDALPDGDARGSRERRRGRIGGLGDS